MLLSNDTNDLPTWEQSCDKYNQDLCKLCLPMRIRVPKHKCKKHKELKAGGIILDTAGEHILLIKGVYANKWNVPKGSCSDNESIRCAAIREIKEETGVDVCISKYDVPVKIYKVFLYLLTIHKNTLILPLDTREIHDARWVSIAELYQLKDKTTLLKKVISYLENKEL